MSRAPNLDNTSETFDEKLLDPRLIPKTVRRSLLALHRESQENIYMHRPKEKTQSENDVHGAFAPWKIKMKSKLKRTHHPQQQQQQQQRQQQQHQFEGRPYAHTLSISPPRQNSNEHGRRISEYAAMSEQYRFSTPPPRTLSISTTPTFRRSLKNCQKYSTQSTSESEATQGDLPVITSTFFSTDDDESAVTVLEKSGKTPPASP